LLIDLENQKCCDILPNVKTPNNTMTKRQGTHDNITALCPFIWPNGILPIVIWPIVIWLINLHSIVIWLIVIWPIAIWFIFFRPIVILPIFI
jgi:hypothetical protein